MHSPPVAGVRQRSTAHAGIVPHADRGDVARRKRHTALHVPAGTLVSRQALALNMAS